MGGKNLCRERLPLSLTSLYVAQGFIRHRSKTQKRHIIQVMFANTPVVEHNTENELFHGVNSMILKRALDMNFALTFALFFVPAVLSAESHYQLFEGRYNIQPIKANDAAVVTLFRIDTLTGKTWRYVNISTDKQGGEGWTIVPESVKLFTLPDNGATNKDR